MHILSNSVKIKQKDSEKRRLASPEHLYEMAFNNSLHANIIFIAADGRIVTVNKAAYRLLGYTKRELLTKNRKDILSVSEDSYKEMLRQRKEHGYAKGDLSVMTKSGRLLPCQISSVIFQDENGIDNSIMSIMDLRER